MREYLSTTSLGDLVRQSRDEDIQSAINNRNEQIRTEAASAATATATGLGAGANTTENTTSESPFASAMRNSIGEVNQ